jgi:HK97 family phage portal protein
MGMVNNFLRRFGYVREEAYKREIEKMQRWQMQTADAQQWTLPDPYIFANQADLYRVNSNLGSALDLLAGDIGMARFHVKRMRGEEELDIPNHEFETLFENPNPLHTGTELVGATVRDYILNGNAAWFLNRNSWAEKPREIWYVPFNRLTPVPDGRMYIKGYEYNPGNGKQEEMLPTWQIVHFKNYNPFHDFIGLSPIESLVDILLGDIGMRKTQRQTYVQNLGEPPSILAFRDYIQDDAWNEVRRKVDESSKNNNMLMLRGVGESVTWMSRAMSNKDMDFVAQLRQNMMDIFNRVAPGALAMLETSANRSTADAARATYSETMWRYMQIVARKVTKEILYVYAWGEKLRGEFDDPRIVDRQLELAEIQEFAKYHTIEEVRQEKYQDDPLGDDRDKLLPVQVNSTTGDGTEPPAQPRPMNEQRQAETMDEPEDETDEASKSVISDLMRLRRMAVGGKTEKVQAFKSDHIPAKMLADIKRRLPLLTQKADIERLFAVKIESFKPKPKVDPLQVLRGLELTVKALEQKG